MDARSTKMVAQGWKTASSVGAAFLSEGANEDDDGGDGDGEEQLNGEDGVDLANEGPTELRVLKHGGVEWPGIGIAIPTAFNISFHQHVFFLSSVLSLRTSGVLYSIICVIYLICFL